MANSTLRQLRKAIALVSKTGKKVTAREGKLEIRGKRDVQRQIQGSRLLTQIHHGKRKVRRPK